MRAYRLRFLVALGLAAALGAGAGGYHLGADRALASVFGQTPQSGPAYIEFEGENAFVYLAHPEGRFGFAFAIRVVPALEATEAPVIILTADHRPEHVRIVMAEVRRLVRERE